MSLLEARPAVSGSTAGSSPLSLPWLLCCGLALITVFQHVSSGGHANCSVHVAADPEQLRLIDLAQQQQQQQKHVQMQAGQQLKKHSSQRQEEAQTTVPKVAQEPSHRPKAKQQQRQQPQPQQQQLGLPQQVHPFAALYPSLGGKARIRAGREVLQRWRLFYPAAPVHVVNEGGGPELEAAAAEHNASHEYAAATSDAQALFIFGRLEGAAAWVQRLIDAGAWSDWVLLLEDDVHVLAPVTLRTLRHDINGDNRDVRLSAPHVQVGRRTCLAGCYQLDGLVARSGVERSVQLAISPGSPAS
jgi:hypothetical protein